MAFIANFGHKNGVHTWRVNGSKEELTQLILALDDEGAEYKSGIAPKIEHVHNSGYTLLLELLIDNKGAAGNDNRKNKNSHGQDTWHKIY